MSRDQSGKKEGICRPMGNYSPSAVEPDCEPCLELSCKAGSNSTGIGPRHRLSCLSLLPSGPDEVHNRLLRGGRSEPPAILR